MSTGPWKNLMLEVLGEADATEEWDHLLHHVERAFDARRFEGEIRAALDELEREGRINYSEVNGYEVREEGASERREGKAPRVDGGNTEPP